MAGQMRLANRTAVVTGAASGIGRAIAVSLARRRCHLALADVNEAGLAKTAELTAGYGLRVTCHRLDVSDADAVAAFPDVVRAEHPRVDVLVNNAGVALGGQFEHISDADFEWLFGINFRGMVRMTRACLPLLKASDEARLVNLSSVFGLVAPPGQTAYAASKFAVRGFSEALRQELTGTRVGVTVVYPGGVATSIAANARMAAGVSTEEAEQGRRAFEKALRLPPEVAGETIVKAVERRQGQVLVGQDAKLIALVERIATVSSWSIVERLMPK